MRVIGADGALRAMARWPRPRSNDRGGAAMLVAIVLGAGVLLGGGALAVDVGQLQAEREQLQTGADAAAIAVAEGCLGPGGCGDYAGTATDFAEDNANDGFSDAQVCWGGPTVSDNPFDADLEECGEPVGNLTDCIDVAGDNPYVQVRTTTRTEDGTLLPPALAGALAGAEDYDGTTVGACARASYGYPGSGHGLAVTLSTCEWDSFTEGGTTYGPSPPDFPSPAAEEIIKLHGKAGTCAAGNAGWDAPGGFGWLEPDENCEATITMGFTDAPDTGSGVDKPCKDALSDAMKAPHDPLYIPVYDGVTGTGANIEYHIVGYSAFVLTGYRLPGATEKSWLTGEKICSGNDFCLAGYFISGLVPPGSGTGGANFGTKVVTHVG